LKSIEPNLQLIKPSVIYSLHLRLNEGFNYRKNKIDHYFNNPKYKAQKKGT